MGNSAVTAKSTGAVIHQKAIHATLPIAARAPGSAKIERGSRK